MKQSIEIYQSGEIEITVSVENETVWLHRQQLAELFGRDVKTIGKHISNVFKDKELQKDATVANFATVQNEGGREVTREIEYYNLDVIISVGKLDIFLNKTPTNKESHMTQPCHCKSNKPFSQCCEPFLRVLEVPSTAEELMRSRYSAYCLGDVNYLQATTHDHTWSDEELKFIQDWADNSTWQHLDVLQSSEDMVEFKAYYIFEGKQHMHHEKSSFLKVNDMWKYVDGEVYEDKVEFLRNSSCICGSGDKYKRCCFKKLTK